MADNVGNNTTKPKKKLTIVAPTVENGDEQESPTLSTRKKLEALDSKSPEAIVDSVQSDCLAGRSKMMNILTDIAMLMEGEKKMETLTAYETMQSDVQDVVKMLGGLMAHVGLMRFHYNHAKQEARAAQTDAQGKQITIDELQSALRKVKLSSICQKAAFVITATVKEQRDTAARQGPTGNVTLCYTAIQGASKLWELRGDAMREAVHLHNHVVRRELKNLRGFEVKSDAEGFVLAFSRPIDCLRWALKVQTELLGLEWPKEIIQTEDGALEFDEQGDVVFTGLRLRVAFNVGDPRCEFDPNTGRTDYFGPFVNRTSRILPIARGGEIIIGKDAFELLKDQQAFNPQEVAVFSRGDIELKGLEQKEPCHAVVPYHLKKRKFVDDVNERRRKLQAQHQMNTWLSKVKDNSQRKQLSHQVLEELHSSLAMLHSLNQELKHYSRHYANRHDALDGIQHQMDEVQSRLLEMSEDMEEYKKGNVAAPWSPARYAFKESSTLNFRREPTLTEDGRCTMCGQPADNAWYFGEEVPSSASSPRSLSPRQDTTSPLLRSAPSMKLVRGAAQQFMQDLANNKMLPRVDKSTQTRDIPKDQQVDARALPAAQMEAHATEIFHFKRKLKEGGERTKKLEKDVVTHKKENAALEKQIQGLNDALKRKEESHALLEDLHRKCPIRPAFDKENQTEDEITYQRFKAEDIQSPITADLILAAQQLASKAPIPKPREEKPAEPPKANNTAPLPSRDLLEKYTADTGEANLLFHDALKHYSDPIILMAAESKAKQKKHKPTKKQHNKPISTLKKYVKPNTSNDKAPSPSDGTGHKEKEKKQPSAKTAYDNLIQKLNEDTGTTSSTVAYQQGHEQHITVATTSSKRPTSAGRSRTTPSVGSHVNKAPTPIPIKIPAFAPGIPDDDIQQQPKDMPKQEPSPVFKDSPARKNSSFPFPSATMDASSVMRADSTTQQGEANIDVDTNNELTGLWNNFKKESQTSITLSNESPSVPHKGGTTSTTSNSSSNHNGNSSSRSRFPDVNTKSVNMNSTGKDGKDSVANQLKELETKRQHCESMIQSAQLKIDSTEDLDKEEFEKTELTKVTERLQVVKKAIQDLLATTEGQQLMISGSHMDASVPKAEGTKQTGAVFLKSPVCTILPKDQSGVYENPSKDQSSANHQKLGPSASLDHNMGMKKLVVSSPALDSINLPMTSQEKAAHADGVANRLKRAEELAAYSGMNRDRIEQLLHSGNPSAFTAHMIAEKCAADQYSQVEYPTQPVVIDDRQVDRKKSPEPVLTSDEDLSSEEQTSRKPRLKPSTTIYTTSELNSTGAKVVSRRAQKTKWSGKRSEWIGAVWDRNQLL